MFSRSGRIVATALAVAAAALIAAAPASAEIIGGYLGDDANAGLCPTSAAAPEASCTVTQLQLSSEHGGQELLSLHRGVVTHWWVASGPASPATTSVQMRLRILRGGKPAPGVFSPVVTLPLAEPGTHRFPARLPIEPDGELGLDLTVLGTGGGVASAPIAHTEPGIGEIGEWVPPLTDRARLPTSYRHDAELLLEARVEPDEDRDGYGDGTQDLCSYDPRRHSACLPDHVPPRIKLDYARRQNFLHGGKVRLTAKPRELSHVFATSQVEVPGVTYSGYSDSVWVRAGGSANIVLRIPSRALRAAKAALRQGGHPYVKSFITVIDASGNRTRKTVRVFAK